MASAAIASATPVSSTTTSSSSLSSRKTLPGSSSTATTPTANPSSLKRRRDYNYNYNNNNLAGSNNNANFNINGFNTRMVTNDNDGDHDDLLPSTSQSKRQKVAFDSAVEVRVLERWDEKSYAHVREEVKQTFRRKSNDGAGGAGGFGVGAIIDLFAVVERKRDSNDDDGDDSMDGYEADAAPSSSLLRKYLLALTGHTGSLGRDCSGLVYAILDHRWWERDASFVNAYIRFLGSLVSAQSGYTHAVLKMLVGRFLEVSTSTSPNYSSSISSEPLRELRADGERRTSDDVHQAIRYILELSPVASRSLASTISSLYPFETEKTRVHVRYVRNLLRLISYAPELKGDVLACICERLVKIDVQIQVAMDDLEEDKEDELLQQIANNDMEIDKVEEEDEASDDESVITDDSDSSEDGRTQLLRENLIKLDSVMAVLFDYYTTAFSDTDQTHIEDTFEQLLSSFTNTILPTFRSRHIQFLIFHFAQGSSDFMERFVGALAQVAFDKARPGFIQQAGAAYLASFVSRGMHLSADMVQDVVAFLGNQLDRLRELHEPSTRGPDLRKYGSYYATAQAILYIFCFRWQDLIIHSDDVSVDEDEALYGDTDFDWASNIKGVLNRNIYSKLNPLKICSPAIVTQFAHVARQLRFMYVFPLLESNKRIRLSHIFGTSSSEYRARNESGISFGSKVSDRMYQLDAYFPFDPYQLPKSKRWIEGDYKEWKSLVEDETYQEEDYKANGSVSSDLAEEDGDDDDDDEEMVNGVVRSDSDSE